MLSNSQEQYSFIFEFRFRISYYDIKYEKIINLMAWFVRSFREIDCTI